MNKVNMDTIRQKKTYQDDKWKLQDPLSPYSNSGDHQFIPLKFRQEMNTSPKIKYGAMEGARQPTKHTCTEFSQLAANFGQKWV